MFFSLPDMGWGHLLSLMVDGLDGQKLVQD